MTVIVKESDILYIVFYCFNSPITSTRRDLNDNLPALSFTERVI